MDKGLIANEAIENCQENKEEGNDFKLDFEKAYDHAR